MPRRITPGWIEVMSTARTGNRSTIVSSVGPGYGGWVKAGETAEWNLVTKLGETRGVPLKIAVTAGADEGTEVALNGLVEVGTDPACGLVLSDPAVSRRHLVVSVGEGSVLVKDLGSRNGT